jgi:tRNA-splicing ligase RtcB (3'-phosphate/5'-hydroxy nucleic acid ligase)
MAKDTMKEWERKGRREWKWLAVQEPRKEAALDIHKLLAQAGYRGASNYKEIAHFAASLARTGHSEAEVLARVTQQFAPREKVTLRSPGAPVRLFGEMGVDLEPPAVKQAYDAAALPITQRVVVLPDGHPGYGVPIGAGVETESNAVIPGAVGMDIGCRMRLSIVDISPEAYRAQRARFAQAARQVGKFGLGAQFSGKTALDHKVMSDPRWSNLPVKLKSLAQLQLGTSGGGNHFLDIVTGTAVQPFGKLAAGEEFVAIMTHSGSRNPGKQLAEYYMALAVKETAREARGIPRELCWLRLDQDAGREYWDAMSLMGDYASACHELIHQRLLSALGLQARAVYENHHNFAWRTPSGILHRKGATPAGRGEFGIIPGSSGTPSYLCIGKGSTEALETSSHGAGRPCSRSEAKRRHDPERFRRLMAKADILHYGVAPDETAFAYKDIRRVMEMQRDIVDVVAEMHPSIVVMGGRADDGD